MEPLDLTKAPPRSPRERLDGLTMLPRTIDKLRATLPGGNPGVYGITGMSGRLLEWLGVDEEAMRAAVAAAKDDDEVAAWLRAHTDASQYPEFNERTENRAVTDIPDRARFAANYPWWAEGGPRLMVDVLEEDDRRMFP